MKLPFYLFFLLLSSALLCQDEIQFEKFHKERAERAMEQNKWAEALESYELLNQKIPSNREYDYNIAMMHYRMGQYREAAEKANQIVQAKPADLNAHRLLANALDLQDNYQGAVDHLRATIGNFPNDGELFFDLGVIEYLRGNDQAALDVWEDGIKADPYYGDNYYWATKMYAESNKPIWALMYGEMFLNVEKGTERFAEISKLITDLYMNYVEQKENNYVVVVVNHPEQNSFEEAFEQTYRTLRQNGMLDVQREGLVMEDGSFSKIKALSFVRKQFLDLWKQTQQHKFSIPLFEWQQKLSEDGHLVAYMHWLLLNGDANYFLNWQKNHRDAFDNFLMNLSAAPLRIDVLNYFMRKDHIRSN